MKNLNKYIRQLLLAGLLAIGLAPFQNSNGQVAATNNTTGRTLQVPKACGGYTIDTAAMRRADAYGANPANKALSTAYTVRLYFHICTDDNGTNAAATEADIKNELNVLIFDNAGNNICFVNMGVDYVNNSAVNNMNPINSSLLQPFLVPNCINIFYQQQIGNAGGNAYAIPNTFCSIATGNIGQGHTISHEVGHCMGLWHTFESASGLEKIDGSNSSIAGDQVTDTPADPYAYSSQSCFSTINNAYNGTCTDPNGQSNFTVPYTNLMAYWWIYGYQATIVTLGQFSRVNNYLATNNALIGCESSDSYTIPGPDTYSSGYNMFSTINTLTTSGSLLFTGNTITTFGGNLVDIQPGFVASPSAGGLILMRPSICLPVPLLVHQRGTIEQSFDAKVNTITSYPNPFTQQTTIRYSLPSDGNVDVKIYNTGMQMVAHPLIGSKQLKGNHQIVFNAGNLHSGIYFCKLETQGKVFTVKMILIK